MPLWQKEGPIDNCSGLLAIHPGGGMAPRQASAPKPPPTNVPGQARPETRKLATNKVNHMMKRGRTNQNLSCLKRFYPRGSRTLSMRTSHRMQVKSGFPRQQLSAFRLTSSTSNENGKASNCSGSAFKGATKHYPLSPGFFPARASTPAHQRFA